MIAVFCLSGIGGLSCAGATDSRDFTNRARTPRTLGQALSVSSLSSTQLQALEAGELVTVPMVEERAGRRYTGGAAHLLVEAPASSVFDALTDVAVIERVLPKTKRATLLSTRDRQWQVELLQGNRFIEATYTVKLHQAHLGNTQSHRIEFALDRSSPHDIDDLWGFFAVKPLGPNRCVVSVAAFVDLGDSLAVLFERRIQDLILTTPLQVRDYFATAQVSSIHNP